MARSAKGYPPRTPSAATRSDRVASCERLSTRCTAAHEVAVDNLGRACSGRARSLAKPRESRVFLAARVAPELRRPSQKALPAGAGPRAKPRICCRKSWRFHTVKYRNSCTNVGNCGRFRLVGRTVRARTRYARTRAASRFLRAWVLARSGARRAYRIPANVVGSPS